MNNKININKFGFLNMYINNKNIVTCSKYFNGIKYGNTIHKEDK